MLTITSWWSRTRSASGTQLSWRNSVFPDRKCKGFFPTKKIFPTAPTKLQNGIAASIKAFASRKSTKKLRRNEGAPTSRNSQANKNPSDEYDGLADISSSCDESVHENNDINFPDNDLAAKNSSSSPSRSTVLQACVVTSGLILAFGLGIRQASHIAFMEGLPIVDCSAEVPFDFQTWHLELIMGLVVLISSCRYLLLKTWPDFAESSEAANQQFFRFSVRCSLWITQL